MKRIYSGLNRVREGMGTKLRNVLEFDGGAVDTQVHTATAGVDEWNILTRGSTRYRVPAGSQPQARIPSGHVKHAFEITYYPRDVRRLPEVSPLPIETNFAGDAAKLLVAPATVPNADAGSPGQKNPDVQRYDPTGLRTAMTANWAALNASLKATRANHLPTPRWQKFATAEDNAALGRLVASGVQPHGLPEAKRISKWQHTQANEW